MKILLFLSLWSEIVHSALFLQWNNNSEKLKKNLNRMRGDTSKQQQQKKNTKHHTAREEKQMWWLKIARCATTDWLFQLLSVQFFFRQFSSVKVCKMHWKPEQKRQAFLFSLLLFNPFRLCLKTDRVTQQISCWYWCCCYRCYCCCSTIVCVCVYTVVYMCVSTTKIKGRKKEISTTAAGAHQQLIKWETRKQKHTSTRESDTEEERERHRGRQRRSHKIEAR